jgi:AcrR family transcriptional regulator
MKHGNKTKLRILNEANKLFYQQGFNATSFSNIVDATGLSKGNITYHFKNKQEILNGIVESRLVDIDELLIAWNKEFPSPINRLVRFCEMLLDEQDSLEHYGCPMGTLTTEFSKNQPALYQITLPMFKRFQTWLIEQFTLLNFSSKQANENALELLSRVQGIAIITHVFKDKKFLKKEISKLKDEIQNRYDGASLP